jgi:hypothetical protein
MRHGQRGAILIALCVLPRLGNAQAVLVLLFGDKFASENVQGGIKFDVAFSKLSGLPDATRRRSWDLGGFLEVKLGNTLSIQPEFTFKSPAGASSLPFVPTGLASVDNAFSAATDVSVTRDLGYITLPVLLKIKTGRMAFGLGPQVGYIVRAEDHYTGTLVRENDLSYDVSLWPRVNRWDAGLNALAEFNLDPHLGLQSLRVRVAWYHGYGDALSDAPGTNESLVFGVGLPIGGRKQTEPVGT